VALVAHPDDERYRPLFGTEVRTPLFNVPVPILAHALASPDKGTGVAMICTFGDLTDVIWWRELNLPVRAIVQANGTLRPVVWGSPGWESRDAAAAQGAYDQLVSTSVTKARTKIVELLRASGEMVGEPRPITHAVKFYEKGDRPLEIVTSRQWFIRTLPFRERLLERGRELQWHPPYMRARFENWVGGLNGDWCVSRQRFFGVPFPVWYPIRANGSIDHADVIVPPESRLPLDPSTSQFMTLTQELVMGVDLSVPTPNRHYRTLPVRSGRFLRDGDRKVAVVGASFAASRGLEVGSHITLEDEDYEVVGVLDRMLTAPDRFVMVSIADARAQWVAKDRLLRTVLASGGMALTAGDLNTGAAVGWRDGDDPDAVAIRIKERVPGVNVQLPSELSRLLRQSTQFFSALLVGIGALAFVIGGLSLANTMAAAVFERIRDFGVKRALGATDLQLGREVLAESLAVTMVGGVGGIALARGLGWFIDRYLAQAQQLFHFSPRLLGGALVFSVLLGAAAAIYATARIVALSPAEAIRRGA